MKIKTIRAEPLRAKVCIHNVSLEQISNFMRLVRCITCNLDIDTDDKAVTIVMNSRNLGKSD